MFYSGDVCGSVCNIMIAFINVKVVYYYLLRFYAFCFSLECIIAHYFLIYMQYLILHVFI